MAEQLLQEIREAGRDDVERGTLHMGRQRLGILITTGRMDGCMDEEQEVERLIQHMTVLSNE